MEGTAAIANVPLEASSIKHEEVWKLYFEVLQTQWENPKHVPLTTCSEKTRP